MIMEKYLKVKIVVQTVSGTGTRREPSEAGAIFIISLGSERSFAWLGFHLSKYIVLRTLNPATGGMHGVDSRAEHN